MGDFRIVSPFEPQGDQPAAIAELTQGVLRGDKEQLIQALLNIVRNAAEALRERISQGDARIEFETLAKDDFAPIPRDWNWIPSMFVLAAVSAGSARWLSQMIVLAAVESVR